MHGDERGEEWHPLWSVVIMTDCAASGTAPRRAAASATISKAALHVQVTRDNNNKKRAPEPISAECYETIWRQAIGVGETHHSVPTMRMPGSASFRNATQARASSTACSWMPPHVWFRVWVGEHAVYMMRKRKANQKVRERAIGEPLMPKRV